MYTLIAFFLIALPGLLAVFVAHTQSPQNAFLKVYIPTLLLLPAYYYIDPPLLPPVDLNQSAMLGIFLIWIIRGAPGWWNSPFDWLVITYTVFIAVSEYLNAGYKDAQNLAFATLVSVLFPYIIAKSFIEPFNLRMQFVKQVIISLTIVACISMLQFITGGWSLWHRILGRFFGGQGWQWIPQYRWGFGRITGPYGHAILAGIIFAVGFRLQRWLQWSQAWPKRWPVLPWWPLPVDVTLSLIMLAGMFMTLSRGPWIGAFLAVFVVLVGRLKWRWTAVIVLITAVTLFTPVAIERFASYIEELRRVGDTHTEHTLVYRWDLMNTYIDLGMERLYLGWGRTQYPKIPGQRSIDNHFLLFFLMHGIIAVSLLVFMMVLMSIRLFFHDMRLPIADPPGSGLGFTLSSLYLVYGWSIATVFLGEQSLPLLFILMGWSEGYLRYEKTRRLQTNTESNTTVNTAEKNIRFKRILK